MIKKVFLATPAFDGRCHVQYMTSVVDLSQNLLSMGIPLHKHIATSCSLLEAERNRLLKHFLESNCSHILCVDSDLGFSSESVLKMLLHDEPMICGLYPARQERCFIYRPLKQEDGAFIAHPEGKPLLKMECVPAGFMLIKREVIEKLYEDNPDLMYQPKDKSHPPVCYLFQTLLKDGEFWGEDLEFCNKVRASGFDIWVDPTVMFDHAGMVGSFQQLLTNDKPEDTL